MNPPPEYHVFLSHNSADKEAVRRIAEALRNQDLECFYDEWGLAAGRRWVGKLARALRRSGACAVFFGKSGPGPWQTMETELALNLDVRARREDGRYGIIPVRLPGAPDWTDLEWSPFLRLYQGVEFDGVDFNTVADRESLERLAAAISAGQAPAAPEPVDPHLPPWVGMRPMRESESALFFGRDRYVLDLLQRIRTAGQDCDRAVFVLGASGSGKSSLLEAGLLPGLRAGAIPSSEKWIYATVRAGNEPWMNLRSDLRAYDEFRPLVDTLVPAKPESWLHELAVAARGPDISRRVILMVDQFEEAFTARAAAAEDYEPKSLRPFLQNLVFALSQPRGPVTVVFGMRQDFLQAAEKDEDLKLLARDRGKRLVIDAMNKQELRCAILRPARRRGISVEPGLVRAICQDFLLQPAGSLPFLQEALLRLWKPGIKVLREADYDKKEGLQGAVNDHAEEVFERLPEVEQRRARGIFLHLVRLAHDDGKDTKRRMPLADLPGGPAGEVVARKLASEGNRLLTIDSNNKAGEALATVEIAHEALLAGWKQLRAWLKVKSDERLKLRQLEVMARRTDEDGYLHPVLLLTGAALEDAVRLTELLVDETPPSVGRFVDRSREEYKVVRRKTMVALAAVLLLLVACVAWLLHQQHQLELARQKQSLAGRLLQESSSNPSARMRYLLAQEALARADKDQLAPARRALLAASFELGQVQLGMGYYFGDFPPPDFDHDSLFPDKKINPALQSIKVGDKNGLDFRSSLLVPRYQLLSGVQEGRWAFMDDRFLFDLSNPEPCATLKVISLPKAEVPVDADPLKNRIVFSPDGQWMLAKRNVYAVAGLGPDAKPAHTLPGQGPPAFIVEDRVKLVWLERQHPPRSPAEADSAESQRVEHYEWCSLIPGGDGKVSTESFKTAEELIQQKWRVMPAGEREALRGEGAGDLAGRWLVVMERSGGTWGPEGTGSPGLGPDDAETTPTGDKALNMFLSITDMEGQRPPYKIMLTHEEPGDGSRQPFRSANGRWLALTSEGASGNAQARIWDLAAPEKEPLVCPVAGTPYVLRFSPDGRWLLVAGITPGWLFDLHDPEPANSRLQLTSDKAPLDWGSELFSADSRWLLPRAGGKEYFEGILLPLDDQLVQTRHVTPLTVAERKRYLAGEAARWTPPGGEAAWEAAGKILGAEILFRAMDDSTATPAFVKDLADRARDALGAAKRMNATLPFKPDEEFRTLLQPRLDSVAEIRADDGKLDEAFQVLDIQKQHGISAEHIAEQAGILREKAIRHWVIDSFERSPGSRARRAEAFKKLEENDPDLATHIRGHYETVNDLDEMYALLQGPWSLEAEAKVAALNSKHSPLVGRNGIPSKSDWQKILAQWSVWLIGGKVQPDNGGDPVERALERMDSALQVFGEGDGDEPETMTISLGTRSFEVRRSMEGRLASSELAKRLVQLCWFGILRGSKDVARFATQSWEFQNSDDPMMARAVVMASSEKWDEAAGALYHLSKRYSSVAKEYPKLQEWIAALKDPKKPQNPFTPDIVKELAAKQGVVWPPPSDGTGPKNPVR